MKNIFFILIILIKISAQQLPDWIENNGKSSKYDENKFITGYGIALIKNNDKSSALQEAQDIAKANLIQKIIVKIEAKSQSATTDFQDNIISTYQSYVESKSSIEIEGTNFEIYNDKFYYYALAYINKSKITSFYTQKLNDLSNEINENINKAVELSKSNITEAVKIFSNQFKIVTELEKISQILFALDAKITTKLITRKDIENYISQITTQEIKDISDIATQLTVLISNQANYNANLSIANFSYQNTKMGSKFSAILKDELENKFPQITKWNIIKSNSTNYNYVLTGTYWERNENIIINVNLINVKTASTEAAAQFKFNKSILTKEKIDFKPQNFVQAINEAKEFGKDELIDGGILLDVWTDKGKNGLVLKNGELLNVYLRINIPCFIRFIYHQADGTRVLLLDNYYIDESKVNFAYKIPEEFVVTKPFGVENLQIFASTEKFPHLNTNTDGIIIDNLQTTIMKTRGLKKANKKSLQTEARITITTLP